MRNTITYYATQTTKKTSTFIILKIFYIRCMGVKLSHSCMFFAKIGTAELNIVESPLPLKCLVVTEGYKLFLYFHDFCFDVIMF